MKSFGIQKIALIALLAAVLGACAFGSKKEHPATGQLEQKTSQEIVQKIADPSQVSVAKTVKNDENRFVVSPKQHVLTGDKVEELKKMLLDDGNYIFDRTKKCFFVPEIAFKFQGAKEVVLMVSLFCNQVKFIEGEKSYIVDFDPMSKEMNSFCREILDQLDKE